MVRTLTHMHSPAWMVSMILHPQSLESSCAFCDIEHLPTDDFSPHARASNAMSEAYAEQRREEQLLETGIEVVRDWVHQTMMRNAVLRLDGGRRVTVQERIGQGGFGEVWSGMMESGNACAPPRECAARVAVKIAQTKHAYLLPLACDRLRCEARILRELAVHDLPGVPAFHAQGHWQGRPFIVMEQVRGKTLRDLQKTFYAPEEHQRYVRKFLHQTAQILSRLHACGISHGDIKPENILVGTTHDDAPTSAWVIDFGLARCSKNDAPLLDGWTMGTRGFLDPRLIGRGMCDTAGDVYAFAALLYEWYAGRPLFTRAAWESLLEQKEAMPEVQYAALADRAVAGKMHECETLADRQPAIEELLRRSLRYDTRERPGMAECERTLLDAANKKC